PLRRPPSAPLFPYTTLFRSIERGAVVVRDGEGADRVPHVAGGALQCAHRAVRAVLQRAVDEHPDPHGPASRERAGDRAARVVHLDRKSTRLNSSHVKISYAV